MLITSIRHSYRQVPLAVRLFVKRASVLLLSWILLYQLVLKPSGIPDRWLTAKTASVTAYLLNHWYSPGFNTVNNVWASLGGGQREKVSTVFYNNTQYLHIADACNALDLFVLYLGFLFCLPAGKTRMLVFGITGTATIFLLNILRLYALVLLAINKPAWLDIAHHYVFTLIVYSCIFAGWVYYARKNDYRKTI
ncbi:MAG: hypothetical protein JSR37_08780 [Verrucomicrobia bacterium]|nr:hypothetical protein [Verrucomicrobiota bacterium]